MRVIITAGGTGGHFYPGLAVARELIAMGDNVSFIIKKGDYVLPLLEREKIPFTTIAAGGFKRKLALSNLTSLMKLFSGFLQAYQYLLKENPDTLLVMGGYLSVPPAIAAKLQGIPVILHEQNAVPGLANRLLSRFASKIAVSFEQSVDVFGKKAVFTGNPVRREFFELPSQGGSRHKWGLDPDKKTFLVFGGSLGAQRLNQIVVDAFESLPQYAEQFQVIHITGAEDVAPVRARYGKTPYRFYVDSYCHDMPSAYAASDFVISRAGASTVSEVMVVKRPAIFVPYPLATNGHQTANAKVLVEMGRARVYEQKDLAEGAFNLILEGIMRLAPEWPKWGYGKHTLPIDLREAATRIAALIREVRN